MRLNRLSPEAQRTELAFEGESVGLGIESLRQRKGK